MFFLLLETFRQEINDLIEQTNLRSFSHELYINIRVWREFYVKNEVIKTKKLSLLNSNEATLSICNLIV